MVNLYVLRPQSEGEKIKSASGHGDHSTPILEYGLKYKALGVAPDAAQFIQTRQFSIQDVARF